MEVFLAWFFHDGDRCLECGKRGETEFCGVFTDLVSAANYLADNHYLSQSARIELVDKMTVDVLTYDDWCREYYTHRAYIEKHSPKKY